MATTWTISGIALGPTGPVNGATIYAWKAQRFATAPAQNAAAPTGSADAGPVTSGTVYGGPGAYNIQCPTNEAYYIAVTYNAITYWTYVNDLNFTDMAESTVAVASNGVSLTTLAAGTSLFGVTTGFNSAGRINVTTSGGQAVLAYTSVTGGGSPSFNGISIISGTGAWTVATGAAITQAQQVATLNQVLDDGSGDATITGGLVVGGSFVADTNATVGGSLLLSGALTATTNATIGGTLVVDGNATFSSTSGAVTFSGDVRTPNLESYLTASTTVNTTALTASGLSFPIKNLGNAYMVDAELDIAVASTGSTGIGVAVSLPTGATWQGSVIGWQNSTLIKQAYFTGVTQVQGLNTTTGTFPIRVQGVVSVGTATSNSTGNFGISVSAQSSAASTVANVATLALGSFLIATRIN